MEEVKEGLIGVAGKTFGKYGFHKTSMEDIAKRARKAKGSIYYYFGSKELLFKEVISKELGFLKEELLILFNQQNADSRKILKAYMLKRMEILKVSINYQETIRPEFYECYDFLTDQKKEMVLWETKQVTKILNSGIASGEIELHDDAKIYAKTLVMLLKGLEISFYIDGEYDNLKPYLNNLTHVIIKGISK